MTDPKTVWKTQLLDPNSMSTLSEVRARAGRFQAHVRWRNIALYVYSALSIVFSVWLIARGAFPYLKVPMLLMVAAHLLVLWQINRRISARILPGDMEAQPSLDFHRQQLERQAHGLSHAWLWYMMPFIVPFVWELGIVLGRFKTGAVAPDNFKAFLLLIVVAVLFWTLVLLVFSRAALRVRLRIERLNVLKAE